MEKIVYLLGAGFSAPLGIPVMANFLQKAKDLFYAEPERFPHFKQVFQAIDKMHVSKTYFDTDLLNIEEILSVLEMDQQLTRPATARKFSQFISDVVKSYTPPNSPSPAVSVPTGLLFGKLQWQPYGAFVSALLNVKYQGVNRTQGGNYECYRLAPLYGTATQYSVITLNYDLVLEEICGFINQQLEGNYLRFARSHDPNPLGPRTAYLAKLHGSIDTGRVIPPTWNKRLVGKDILEAWRLGQRLLSEANQIRIIGYSLAPTDSYIKYLLRSAVVDAPNLKRIDVICKDSDDKTRQRYSEFIVFRDWRFKDTTVEAYFSKLGTVDDQQVLSFDNIEQIHELVFH